MADKAELAYLGWLAGEEETRQKNVVLARNYYDGVQGVELTERQKKFLNFQSDQGFSLNYCATVVNSVAERLIVEGFLSGDEGLMAWAEQLGVDVRLDALQLEIHLAAVLDGETFLMVDWDEEEGLQLIPHPRYTDPLAEGTGFGCKAHYPASNPRKMEFASKRWTETRVNEGGKRETARRMNLYYPNRVEKYVQAGRGEGTWQRTEVGPRVDGQGRPLGIPVIHFRSPADRSELWNAIGPQDIINKTGVDILAAADLAGFPIWVAAGFTPTTDGKEPAEDGGNYIKIHPGCIIGPIPAEGRLEKIEASDIEKLLKALDSWIFKLAQVTDTPLSRFQATRQIASDETLKQQEGPLLAKIGTRQTLFGNAWENALYMARRLANALGGTGLDEGSRLETQWRPAETRDVNKDELAFWTAAQAAVEAGATLPAFLRLRGWEGDKIEIVTEDPEYQMRLGMLELGMGMERG